MRCKKFKPADNVSFVEKPSGDCSGCVYFSAANCGMHNAISYGGEGSLFASTV